MAAHDQEKELVQFKDTLNLPTTDFPIRPNAAEEDPRMIQRWEREQVASSYNSTNQGKSTFILHDGPPYANGHIHIGHAYNKILKDMLTKAERMNGKHVPAVIPGWDCHGLPIELKVSSENPGISPIELKKKCREYAQGWIETQKEEFKRLGVIMDWNHPYITMSPDYEASIVRAFGDFVAQGYIERKNKTVPWCASCKTVLATAEIEYAERKDPSLYVLFRLEQSVVDALSSDLAGTPVDLVIWTTTPWTLPLNRAVMIRPGAEYVVIEHAGKHLMVGKSLADSLAKALGIEKKVIATIQASQLLHLGARAHHPFVDIVVPLIGSESVTLEDGTAFVHCAPGCGPEDYEVGVKHGLEIFSPVSVDGKYTVGINPAELVGMSVEDGQIWVIKTLAARGALLHKSSIKHSYPHCWRCHKGLIFRATKQWFCDLSKHQLKARVLKTIDGITTYPEKSKNRLEATVDGRLEWCLSRQRIWGVPIPALLCINGDYTYTHQEFISMVADKIAQEGIEYWDRVTVQELMPQGLSCPECSSTTFIKEEDILDVWFDSGVSHYAVLKKQSPSAFPASLYLEGKDQHRGWFQSSLLTAQVIEDAAPMKSILTHGFTVDQQGRKMSKSLGNVVSPEQMIKEMGTDGLRLWVSSIDYADDAVVSPVLIANVKEVFRKIRNTCRFLLSNLYDYDHEQHAVAPEKLMVIDAYALEMAARVNERIQRAYASYNFTGVYHELADYCSSELSAFYLDIIKDRLYVEQADGYRRRSAQTVCWIILDMITRAMAPILSFTAEQISDLYQRNKQQSIHLQSFASFEYRIGNESFDRRWKLLKQARSAILKAIEQLRAQGIIKHSLEASVTIAAVDGSDIAQILNEVRQELPAGQDLNEFLKEFIIVSQVSEQSEARLVDSELNGLMVHVDQALGIKCPRCWHWDETTNQHGLCRRCATLLNK